MWPAGKSIRSRPRIVRALAESDHVFVALPRQARLHQPRGSFGDDDFVMRRDVIAVGMRDKREWLSVPGIQPKVFLRQINAPVVANFDHKKFYPRNGARETGIRVRSSPGLH